MNEAQLRTRIKSLAKHATNMRAKQKEYFKNAKTANPEVKRIMLNDAKAAEQRFDSFIKQLDMEGLI